MTAPGTMARVYQALKARILAGEFAPGERIDPSRLSGELSASATPIRDALQRLVGERLVENWQNEGFRQPFVTEAGLRDLYGWSGELVPLVFRAAERSLIQPRGIALPNEPARATIELFDWLAGLSPNHEHRAAMSSLNDRCHALRIAEARLLRTDVAALSEAAALVVAGDYARARHWSATYHALRLRHVSALAAQFRPRDNS